jgi:hypothetical protein
MKQTQVLKQSTTLSAAPIELISNADLAALSAEANELVGDVRVGDDLRFTKGKWAKFLDDDTKQEIGKTASFCIDLRSYKRGWIEWRDQKPVRKIIGRPIDGFVSPTRYQLGNLDKSKWPRDGNGVPQDIWQENFMLVMRALDDGRLCTWKTNSWFGSKALGAFLAKALRECVQHPGCMPVVLLSSEDKPTIKFGDVAAPVLTIVDWQPFGEGAAPPGMPTRMRQPQLSAAQEVLPPNKQITTKIGAGADLEDEIPF